MTKLMRAFKQYVNKVVLIQRTVRTKITNSKTRKRAAIIIQKYIRGYMQSKKTGNLYERAKLDRLLEENE